MDVFSAKQLKQLCHYFTTFRDSDYYFRALKVQIESVISVANIGAQNPGDCFRRPQFNRFSPHSSI